jgi:integrase/recombinase XerD
MDKPAITLRKSERYKVLNAAGITNFLENGGSLEAAQRMASHADSRTTKLYDRRDQKILVADVERVRYSD